MSTKFSIHMESLDSLYAVGIVRSNSSIRMLNKAGSEMAVKALHMDAKFVGM